MLLFWYAYGYSIEQNKWYKYNDDCVRASNINNINTSEVYMLFYEKIKTDE